MPIDHFSEKSTGRPPQTCSAAHRGAQGAALYFLKNVTVRCSLKRSSPKTAGAHPYANLSDLLLRKQKAKQQSIIVPCLAAMKCFYMAA